MLHKTIKTFIAFIPFHYLLYIILTMVLKQSIEVEYPQLFDAVVNLTFFYILLKIFYFIREAGRLIIAKLVGGVPHHIVVGSGQSLASFEVFRVKVGIYEKINASNSMAFFENKTYLKLRYSLYLSGRMITNGSLALFLFILFGFDIGAVTGDQGFDLISMATLANMSLFLRGFFSEEIDYRHKKFRTDGLTLLKLNAIPRKILITDINEILLLDANDYRDQGKYRQSYRLYKKLINQKNTIIKCKSRLNFGQLLLRYAKFQKSLIVYKSIEDLMRIPIFSDSLSTWHQGLAWSYLALEEAHQAHLHAQQAYRLSPKDTQLIQGATLVASDKPTEGVTLLEPFIDFHSSQNQSIMAAIFVCDGFLRQGKLDQAGNYYSYVQKHASTLRLMEQYFWNKVSVTFRTNGTLKGS